ncbi:MAG: hypothetical protein WAV86_04055 [Lutibacter sp.]
MKIELIPVIELNEKQRNMVSESTISYEQKLQFYRIQDINNDDLSELIKDHTEGFRNGEYEREQASALFGGYVLKIDGINKYFPQCCGDLADIKYWDRLSNGQDSYSEGHPAPQVKIDCKELIFDFSVDEFDEPFQPTPPEIQLKVDKQSLKLAVEQAKRELELFSVRLKEISNKENLNIENIEGLLIWENPNYE